MPHWRSGAWVGRARRDNRIYLVDNRKPKRYHTQMDARFRPGDSSLADALFGKTKKAVIARLFSHPEQSWHLRELARIAGVSPTMLSKEADTLLAAGIILDQRDGNRRRLRANPACPIYDELRGIARKTAGVADIIKGALSDIVGIDYAFIFGSVARGQERAGSDVDVCLVGSATNREVSSAMTAIEGAVGRPVNPILYTLSEIRAKVASENPFVTQLLQAEKLFLIGDDDGFRRAVGQSENLRQFGFV